RSRTLRGFFSVGHGLERTTVAVRVFEEDEASPREDLDVADIDAAFGELLAARLGVVDDHLQAVDRARLHPMRARGERDRARGSGRRELDETKLVGHLVIMVGIEA